MPPVAAQKLVADLREFCEKSDTPNKQIAEKLGLSASGLSDALSGKNQLTASQQILARNLIIIGTGKPRTLSVVHDRIAELEAELESRAPGAITPTASIISPPPPKPATTFVHGSKAGRATARPTGVQLNEENDGWAHDKVHKPNPNAVPMPTNGPPPRKLRLDPAAITPWMVSEIAKVTSLEDLREMFGSEKDVDRRGWLYQEITKRRQS